MPVQWHVIEELGHGKYFSVPVRLLSLTSSSSVYVPHRQDKKPFLQNSTFSSSTSHLGRLSELSVSDKGYFHCGRISALWGRTEWPLKQQEEEKEPPAGPSGKMGRGRQLSAPRMSQTQTRMFSVMSGEQRLKCLYLERPQHRHAESGF